MPQLLIDDQPVQFTEGQTILQAAASVGIRIPTLCHHPDLSDVGSCRICLVELNGDERLVPACKQPQLQEPWSARIRHRSSRPGSWCCAC